MNFPLFLLFILNPAPTGDTLLNQDIIYKKAAEEKMPENSKCVVITQAQMDKARGIFNKYWKKSVQEAKWEDYNRQYLVWVRPDGTSVVYINGTCNLKPAAYYEESWELGGTASNCYFTAFIDLKKKKVTLFKFNRTDTK